MDLHLAGHVAVVTGGASGIGRAVAEALAAEGVQVAIWDRDPASPALAGELAERYDVPSVGSVVDVTVADTLAKALKRTEQSLGRVDHLVHAAAVGSGKFGFPFLNVPVADWPRVLEVNVLGMAHVAHLLAPRMIERRRGTMVFLASVAGQIGSSTDPPYSAAKAANINFAICLARDLAPHGVRVNTVCPGMVRTPLVESIWRAWQAQQPPEHQRSFDAWAEEKIRSMVPLGQWQQPSDVADAVLFLSSERARQITGQTINVDGGFVMHW